MNLEEVRAYFAADRFAAEVCGITIEEVSPGEAFCRMEIADLHKNALGGVQGGAIFTLADFAFAVASNQNEAPTVSLSNHITYLRGSGGTVLFARARQVSSGRRIAAYQATVTDDLEQIIAVMSVTGYIRNKEPQSPRASEGLKRHA